MRKQAAVLKEKLGGSFHIETSSGNSHWVEFGRKNTSRLGWYPCRYFPVRERCNIWGFAILVYKELPTAVTSPGNKPFQCNPNAASCKNKNSSIYFRRDCRRQQAMSVCTEPEGISLDVIRKGISGKVSAEKSPTPYVPSAHICVFSRNSWDGMRLGLILPIFLCCFYRIMGPKGLQASL